MDSLSKKMDSVNIGYHRFMITTNNGRIWLIAYKEDFNHIISCMKTRPCYGTETFSVEVHDTQKLFNKHFCLSTKHEFNQSKMIKKKLYVESNSYISHTKLYKLLGQDLDIKIEEKLQKVNFAPGWGPVHSLILFENSLIDKIKIP